MQRSLWASHGSRGVRARLPSAYAPQHDPRPCGPPTCIFGIVAGAGSAGCRVGRRCSSVHVVIAGIARSATASSRRRRRSARGHKVGV